MLCRDEKKGNGFTPGISLVPSNTAGGRSQGSSGGSASQRGKSHAPVLLEEVGRLLCDHDGGGVGVACDDERHDGSVHHPHPSHASQPDQQRLISTTHLLHVAQQWLYLTTPVNSLYLRALSYQKLISLCLH